MTSTTRSGRTFKPLEGDREAMADGETTSLTTEAGPKTADSAELVKMLMQEREKREREVEQERKFMQEQMDALMKLVREQAKSVTPAKETVTVERDVKFTKFTETDDIEAYLTTFERTMNAFKVPQEQWVYKLAPQLTGKAQQAFAAMETAGAGNYTEVKAAILQRYNINEETYRQRLRSIRPKEEETHQELAVRVQDLTRKWAKDCKKVEDVLELIATEQLLEALPTNIRIWVRERKPKTATEAGQLADDYVQARRQESNASAEAGKGGEPTRNPAKPKCDNCGRIGHRTRDCRSRPARSSGSREPSKPTTGGDKEKFKDVTCWKCFQKGHIAVNCPGAKTMFCDGTQRRKRRSYPRAVHPGLIEGVAVSDIMLDTGSNRTLVRRDLVPAQKMVEGEIPIRCAHGDIITYPIAVVEIEIGGRHYAVEAGVVDGLPVSALLGWDNPDLEDLLQQKTEPEQEPENAMAVTTRAQRKKREEEAAIQDERDRNSGADPNPIEKEAPLSEDDVESVIPGAEFADELFSGGRTGERKTRKEKRENNHRFIQEQKEKHPLEMTAGELSKLQEEDDSLEAVRKAARGEVGTAGGGFFKRDGIIYRRWTPPGLDEGEASIDQLVLPASCRKAVLQLAHAIPLAGHMGRKKTAQRVLARFYWPNVFKDAAEICRTCKECQKTAPGKKTFAPLIPLPIIEEPFQRIAMDLVGPLPRSRSGNKYILVICDYATRYPEAIPLRSIDAEHIAEELIKVFSRVGVPKEILTDQGSNFTSQLLAEVYRLLHIQPIKTSPYHPQTDGLVERFNQTLKAMLRKTAWDEGKDWDKWVPYLLFAYREVPQSSTGFSPFELVYGRQVRGPLDILKETWETSKKSKESIISYVLSMQEKLSEMSELARENLAKAQKRQKRWYDENARERRFEPGDQVLVLLPTETNKLLAQWHGPYPVLRRLSAVNYEVDMYDKKKRRRIFHINMLRKWYTPSAASLLAEDLSADPHDEIPLWREDPESDKDQPVISDQLDGEQREQLQTLLSDFGDVLSNEPGRTTITEHNIETGDANPIRLQPYRLPHAYRDTVRKDLQDMEESGIIEPSTSEWAAPIVLVKKKDGTLRFCVDYRKLNSRSQSDAYPMPRIDELIDQLGQAKYVIYDIGFNTRVLASARSRKCKSEDSIRDTFRFVSVSCDAVRIARCSCHFPKDDGPATAWT